MSIISALLTGGIVIGKICQAIGGSGLSKSSEGGQNLMVSGDVSAGGVVFYRSNVTGPSMIYAYNPNTRSPATVVVPNGTGSGLTYVIAPTEKIPFAEAESPLIPPSTVITTGLTDAAVYMSDEAQASAGLLRSLFKMSFSGLSVGKAVNVGSFRLSCTTTQLTIVSSQITLMAMTYMYLNANTGIQASNTATIPRNVSTGDSGLTAANEAVFNIDFGALGFNMANDILDGQLTLSLDANSGQLLGLSHVASQPLHPVEREALKKYDQLA